MAYPEDRSRVADPRPFAKRVVTTPVVEAAVSESGIDEVVLEAAKAEFAATEGKIRQVDVGKAERDDSGTAALYRVQAPLIDLDQKPPGEIFLGKQSGNGAHYKVQIRYASPTHIVVEASDDIPIDAELRLYLRTDPGVVAKAFVDYLEACEEPRLASVLTGHGRLDVGTPHRNATLNVEQERAAGAILSPGVAMVWGPPGTGKTRVIGAAVTELLRRGQTVALVSNTNVAVDQALLQVCRSTERFEAGEILRVGYPSIPDVSAHPSLMVAKAVQVKFQDLVSQLDGLQAELNVARSDEAIANGDRLDDLLEGLTASDLDRLIERRTQLNRRASVTTQVERLSEMLANCQLAFVAKSDVYKAARAASSLWADSLGLLENEDAVLALSDTIGVSDRRLAEVDEELRVAMGAGRLRRSLEIEDLKNSHAALAASRADAIVRRSAHVTSLEGGIQRGADPAIIRATVSVEAAAESELSEVKRLVVEHTNALRVQRDIATNLVDLMELSEDEAGALVMVDRWGGTKQLFEAARRQRDAAKKLVARIIDLSSKIDDIQSKLRDQETSLVTEARVVGTTLAQLVLNRGLNKRRFDHIIIDEASAALPPYVFAAMTKADIGCTLVGDFEQNWPITACDHADLSADIEPWLISSPFGLLGVSSAMDAERTNGCVVLRDQYRFGEQTTKLANAIAYGGILRTGRPTNDSARIEPEVVIVDTSTLLGGAAVERGPSGAGRWWGAGAALSYEIARQHDFIGVGVVTPYRHQVQLTRARMLDGGRPDVQVGTSHAFQGREFPVVIADLVEDGTGTSWTARANREGSAWARDGARLFNVAITRNAGRLYLLANLGTIERSTAGPLGELACLLRAGGAEVWDAQSVLGDCFTTIHKPVSTHPNQPVKFLDDIGFYTALASDFETAMKRIIIFSPFLGDYRIGSLLPALRGLVERGVAVTVFTKTKEELKSPKLLDDICAIGVRAHELRGMHEKLVIVDDNAAYLGSLNVLSNSGNTTEVMCRFEGEMMNSQLAHWMRERARRSS